MKAKEEPRLCAYVTRENVHDMWPCFAKARPGSDYCGRHRRGLPGCGHLAFRAWPLRLVKGKAKP